VTFSRKAFLLGVDNLSSPIAQGTEIMSSVGSISSGNNNLQPLIEPSPIAGDDPFQAANGAVAPGAEGVKVSLSGAGQSKSSAAQGANSDIEESGLPENIQQLLKMIRKLQQQIAEKMAEMQAVLADKHLTPEQTKARLGSLQAALAGLNAGLLTANNALAKAMKTSGLSPEQVLKAASLLMKP
jgi:hypothetical protein